MKRAALAGLLATIVVAVAGVAPRALSAGTPRLLIVVAHPDDEYCFAATIFRAARELHGTVDQFVITNGEAGFRWSLPSEYIYGTHLSDEKIGRRELPAIRKRELENAGKILGVHSHIYLDQKDFGYTKDPSEAFAKWDRAKISKVLHDTLASGDYDAVLTLLPVPGTHGHHKAATILALDAVADLPPAKRPVVLGCSNGALHDVEPGSGEARAMQEAHDFQILTGFPQTRVSRLGGPWVFDRRTPFGPQGRLNYHIYVNWMIAEHKSQGMFQQYYSKEDLEEFRLFEIGPPDSAARANALMAELIPRSGPQTAKN